MTSSVLSFAFVSPFPNINIFETNRGICERYMAFLIFQGILCGESKTSRAKNLIVVKQTEIDTLFNDTPFKGITKPSFTKNIQHSTFNPGHSTFNNSTFFSNVGRSQYHNESRSISRLLDFAVFR